VCWDATRYFIDRRPRSSRFHEAGAQNTFLRADPSTKRLVVAVHSIQQNPHPTWRLGRLRRFWPSNRGFKQAVDSPKFTAGQQVWGNTCPLDLITGPRKRVKRAPGCGPPENGRSRILARFTPAAVYFFANHGPAVPISGHGGSKAAHAGNRKSAAMAC